jgi:hypothetical protein
MVIKNLICNYNVKELLLTTSTLVFALDVWVAQNTYNGINYYITCD